MTTDNKQILDAGVYLSKTFIYRSLWVSFIYNPTILRAINT